MNEFNSFPPVSQEVANEDSTQVTRNEAPAGKTSHPFGIAAAVVGSMLAGGGVAYAISKIWPEGEQNMSEELVDEPAEDESQDQVVEVVEDRVIVEHRPAPAKPAPELDPEIETEVEFLGTHVEEIDGEQYVVGEMRINGETVYMVDTDHDGVFDTAGCDSNHNNVIDSNEVVQLPTTGANAVTIAQFQIASGEPVNNHLAEDPKIEDPADDSIELLGIHETFDEDGDPITIAAVRVDGVEVAMIDVDNDGVFDLVARDLDGDGVISEDEVAMLYSPISVGDVAELPHADDYTDDMGGEIVIDDPAVDDTYDDSLVTVSDDVDDDDVEIDESDDSETDSAMEDNDNTPALDSDSYEAPDDMGDDFGMMGDEGINC